MNSKEKGWLLQAYRQVLGSCILTGGAVNSDQRFQRQVCGHPLPLMPKGERWRQRERWRQKGSMLIGGAWVVVINDKGGDCWWNCHWCQHGLDVIDITTLLNSWRSPADDAEDPRDNPEALADNGEAHEVLEPLMKTLMTLQRSWSPLLAIQVISWWPAQIEENMSKGSCQCKQDPHKMIALVMPFPTVGGTSRGSSWLMRY